MPEPSRQPGAEHVNYPANYHADPHGVSKTDDLQPIPDEWLVLALSAAAGRELTTDVYNLIDYGTDEHEAMACALAAVQGPIRRAVEAEVRTKVAEEIGPILNEIRDAARTSTSPMSGVVKADALLAKLLTAIVQPEIARGES